MLKYLLPLVFLILAGCGGNDYELVSLCPRPPTVQFQGETLNSEDLAWTMECVTPTSPGPTPSPTPQITPLIPPPLDEEVIPWGIIRVGGPLLRVNRTVWIIDTGLQLDNQDLNVDVSRSISFVPDESDLTPDDNNGHGTHIAGIIAAKENGYAVVGIAPGTEVVAVKVITGSGWGKWEWVEAGLNYIAENARPGDVVNVSLGGWRTEDSIPAHEAMLRAADKGIFFSVAAGNSVSDIEDYDLASVQHPNVLTVSAMDDLDCMASFSNWGLNMEYAGPGVDILSLHSKEGTKYLSGTSMAAPHVAGLLLYGEPREDGYLTCTHSEIQDDGIAEPIAHY